MAACRAVGGARWSQDRSATRLVAVDDTALTPIWVAVDYEGVITPPKRPPPPPKRRSRWWKLATHTAALAMGILAVLIVSQREAIARWIPEWPAPASRDSVRVAQDPSLDLYAAPRTVEVPAAEELAPAPPTPAARVVEDSPPRVLAHRRARRAARARARAPADGAYYIVTSLDGPVTVREQRVPRAEPVVNAEPTPQVR